MRLSALLLCASLAYSGCHAFAETLVVSASGTFTSNTPTSAISAPDASFSLTFDLDSQPGVFNVDPGNDFSVVPSSFSYLINGTPSTAPVGSVTFFSEAEGGLFSVCFYSACPGTAAPPFGLIFGGDQAYSGSETAPTILTSTYPLNPEFTGIDVNNISYFINSSPVTIALLNTPSAIPEPSSFMLLGTGLLGFAGTLRRRPA